VSENYLHALAAGTPATISTCKVASSFINDATLGQNAKMDYVDEDPGAVFAIPDLWRPSTFLNNGEDHASFLFSHLKLDGRNSPTAKGEVTD
jgi:hypothetical protein